MNLKQEKKNIIDFINNKNELCECNVCFEQKNSWIDYEFCKICNFRICIRCIANTVKTNPKKYVLVVVHIMINMNLYMKK